MKITARQYQGEQDLQVILVMLMKARAHTNDRHYAHVGELLFNFFMVVCHLDPHEHIRLWEDEDGELVGFAILGEDPAFDWQVMTAHEWIGIEAEEFGWVEKSLVRLPQIDSEHWSDKKPCGSRQDDPRRGNQLKPSARP